LLAMLDANWPESFRRPKGRSRGRSGFSILSPVALGLFTFPAAHSLGPVLVLLSAGEGGAF
jgi:hypothetical protein